MSKTYLQKSSCEFLVLNSTESGFLDDVESMRRQLANRLHPESWLSQATYDVDRRMSLLHKLRSRHLRCEPEIPSTSSVNCIVCKLEFSNVTKRLGLQKAWNMLKARLSRFEAYKQSTLPEATLTVAWKCSFSLFRQTYRYNFAPGAFYVHAHKK